MLRKFALFAVMALGLANLAIAQPYYVAGAFQGWDAGNAAYQMTPQGGGLYTFTQTGLAAGSLQEFKVTSGPWSNPNWPIPGNVTGRAGSDGSMTFRFLEGNPNVGFQSDFVTNWSIIGQPGWGYGDWNTGTDGPALTHLGNQVYSVTLGVLQTGPSSFKFRKTGTWSEEQFGQNGGKDSDLDFTFATTGDHTFTIDTRNGTWSVTAIPEPSTALVGMVGLAGMLLRRRRGC